LAASNGKVEFRDVSFTYPKTDKSVLNNISFTVKAGEKIAIIGKSGSGKTTLVDLLPRFHDVHQGEILLDDIPLGNLKLHNLREQIAYVGQEVILFNDTIKNNIAYSDLRDLPFEEVKRAADAAHASEFIEKLPQGFDTMIGDNGVLLSGGQRQRIAIARAILSPAPILILDEATSALDSESENYIQDALSTLLENRTTFVIAHRLSTIESADRIIVMEDGKIVEQGKHQELLDKQGKYAHLYKLQLAGSKEPQG
jgi:subfamily B ATP-binding cassette protein MsbA